MVSKGIIFLEHTAIFNDIIRVWRQKTTKVKMWSTFKTFYHCAKSEQSREVVMAWKEALLNKIEISKPKTILINYIGTPPNPPSKNALAIADSGANIHPEK